MRGEASIGTMIQARTAFWKIPKRFPFSRKMNLQILAKSNFSRGIHFSNNNDREANQRFFL